MKNRIQLREKWQGLADTLTRFPLTILLLLTAVLTNALALETSENIIYIKLLITFFLGAALFVVFQLLYERFFKNPVLRILFMIVSVAVSTFYYLIIREKDWDVEVTIRTIIIFFLLFIAFLWIPVIQSRYNFNESFMAVFKSFFIALFFNGILFLGVALVISAMNILILKVDEQAYLHAANLIFLFIAPTYFLTMLPVFPGIVELTEAAESNEAREVRLKLVTPARFLETLISYVMIPIAAVFTIILLLYIIMNITGKFWTDNLMEPLLLSYSITVIVIYLLASTLHNLFAVYFRKIFPKVLVPVVLFQTLSSVLKISEVGVTYGRYYVILFGIFATIAGVLFCFAPIRKNGLLAPILMVLAVISIVPPVDAFTLSKSTQIIRLEQALLRNGMLNNAAITPNVNVSKEDQSDIVSAVNYLDSMGYTKSVAFLSAYDVTKDFEKTFGFSRYSDEGKEYQSYYYGRNLNDPVPIAGFDYLIQMSIYNQSQNIAIDSFPIAGQSYTLLLNQSEEDNQKLVLVDAQQQELISFDYNQLFSGLSDYHSGKELRSTEEMTFTSENEKAIITIIANSINLSEWQDGSDKSAELLVMIKIK